MKLQSITYQRFCQLRPTTAPERGLIECAWYASSDRRTLAVIALDAITEHWLYVIYFSTQNGWATLESETGTQTLAETECALHEEIAKLSPTDSSERPAFIPRRRPHRKRVKR